MMTETLIPRSLWARTSASAISVEVKMYACTFTSALARSTASTTALVHPPFGEK
jgi:hypothetical protein